MGRVNVRIYINNKPARHILVKSILHKQSFQHLLFETIRVILFFYTYQVTSLLCMRELQKTRRLISPCYSGHRKCPWIWDMQEMVAS